jgi:hypothetical protein
VADAAHFRVHARRAIRLRAVVAQPGAMEWEVQVLDLGLGGACVLLPAAGFSPEGTLTLSLLAPTLWDPLTIAARVAWTLPPLSTRDGAGDGQVAGIRAGLAFEPTDPATVYALFELLTTMSF